MGTDILLQPFLIEFLSSKLVIFSVRLILPKVGVTYLSAHRGKVPSDKKIICNLYQSYNGGNRDFCSHFSVIFEITSKFLTDFVRLILGKVGMDGFMEPRREIDIRYEFGLKVILKGLRCSRDSCSHF